MNIVLISLDSLRYDSAIKANTPNFRKLIEKYQEQFDNWVEVGAHGTYTLPSHISLFQSGILPSKPGLPPPFGRDVAVFRPELKWNRNKPTLYPTPEAENIVKGFKLLGYRTIGIGGVHWFNTNYPTSGLLWKNYFEEFYWQPNFSEETLDAFENQIRLITKLDIREKYFLFINISSTHLPYMNFGKTIQGQAKSLEYVDKHIISLIDMLPKPVHYFIFADHGDCMGEDGFWGHTIAHPKVLNVPMINLRIE